MKRVAIPMGAGLAAALLALQRRIVCALDVRTGKQDWLLQPGR